MRWARSSYQSLIVARNSGHMTFLVLLPVSAATTTAAARVPDDTRVAGRPQEHNGARDPAFPYTGVLFVEETGGPRAPAAFSSPRLLRLSLPSSLSGQPTPRARRRRRRQGRRPWPPCPRRCRRLRRSMSAAPAAARSTPPTPR